MKKLFIVLWPLLLLYIFVAFLGVSYIQAQDDPPVAEETVENIAPEAPQPSSNKGSLGKGIWTFLNSPVGLSVVAFILSIIVGKIFTAKPKWKAYILKYGPSLMQAVKMAEKKIPDDTENKGKARLDAALQYIIELEPKLKADENLKKALAAVHTTAESKGNLKSST